MTQAPNHEEAYNLKVRFRHLHRETPLGAVPTKFSIMCRAPDPKQELAGTIVSRLVDSETVEVSMVIVNPRDAHPVKPSPDVVRLRHALEALVGQFGPAQDDDYTDKGIAMRQARRALSLAEHARPTIQASRHEGRQLAWELLERGHSTQMSLAIFKKLIATNDLPSLLASRFSLPPLGPGIRSSKGAQ